MTLQSTVSVQTLSGDGSTREFPFTFKVWDDHVRVIVTWADRTQRDVTGESKITVHELGGVVAYPAGGGQALPPGARITIMRDMAFTQETDLEEASRYSSTVLESRFDKMTAQDQQLREELSRALLVPVASDLRPDNVVNEVFQARAEAEGAAAAASASGSLAATKAADAGASATSASRSASEAAQSTDLARKWAENPVDAPVSGASYSAYHWSQKAKDVVSGNIDLASPAKNGLVGSGGQAGALYSSDGSSYAFRSKSTLGIADMFAAQHLGNISRNFNEYVTPGTYIIEPGLHLNGPAARENVTCATFGGLLEVYALPKNGTNAAPYRIVQRWTVWQRSSFQGITFSRCGHNDAGTLNIGWGQWMRCDSLQPVGTEKYIASGTDLNSVQTPGLYICEAGASYGHSPVPSGLGFFLRVSSYYVSNATVHRCMQEAVCWQSSGVQGLAYTRGLHGDIKVWSKWRSNGQISVRAWARVNVNGTVAASENISALSNSATGRYTFTMSVSAPDTTYAVLPVRVDDTKGPGMILSENPSGKTVSSFSVLTKNTSLVDAGTAFNVVALW